MSGVVTLNPATGERLAEYPTFTGADVDAVLDWAAVAQTGWAALTFAERAAVLRRAAEVLRDEAEDLALLVTREMGKPLAEARAEVEKCATACDYYAEHAGEFLADEPVATSADRSWIGYEPVGVVLAVMPWNFPLWQVLRFAAPALMAGNAALLKHSPNTTGCALAVQRVLRATMPRGFMHGVKLGMVNGYSAPEAGAKLTMPVLLIQGRTDKVNPGDRNAEVLIKVLKNGKLEWMEAIGHLPEVEAPHAVNKMLRDFFG